MGRGAPYEPWFVDLHELGAISHCFRDEVLSRLKQFEKKVSDRAYKPGSVHAVHAGQSLPLADSVRQPFL
jgi:hypothetical protein